MNVGSRKNGIKKVAGFSQKYAFTAISPVGEGKFLDIGWQGFLPFSAEIDQKAANNSRKYN